MSVDERMTWDAAAGVPGPASGAVMPQDKDIKRLVRARMAESGERYTEAKAAVDKRPQLQRDASVHRDWIEQLAEPETAGAAYQNLRRLPANVVRPLAVEGASHEQWRVRRGCCRLLDDLDFTTESLAALERCLGDGEPRVCRAALHSLSCQHCKPEGCTVDTRGVLERMAHDPNRTVRKSVATALWAHEEKWAEALARHLADHDPSEMVRGIARYTIDSIDRKRRSDTERRRLPAELVAKTERHPHKWVAISEGRIVGVNLTTKQRRAISTDIQTYWVEPAPSGSSHEAGR